MSKEVYDKCKALIDKTSTDYEAYQKWLKQVMELAAKGPLGVPFEDDFGGPKKESK